MYAVCFATYGNLQGLQHPRLPHSLTPVPLAPLRLHPQEKLCPILAMYRGKNFDDALAKAQALVQYGGCGHTSVLYTNPLNTAAIKAFEHTINTVRILINTPAAQASKTHHSAGGGWLGG